MPPATSLVAANLKVCSIPWRAPTTGPLTRQDRPIGLKLSARQFEVRQRRPAHRATEPSQAKGCSDRSYAPETLSMTIAGRVASQHLHIERQAHAMGNQRLPCRRPGERTMVRWRTFSPSDQSRRDSFSLGTCNEFCSFQRRLCSQPLEYPQLVLVRCAPGVLIQSTTTMTGRTPYACWQTPPVLPHDTCCTAIHMRIQPGVRVAR